MKAACGDLSREIREKIDHIDAMKEDLNIVNRQIATGTRECFELQNERNLLMVTLCLIVSSIPFLSQEFQCPVT